MLEQNSTPPQFHELSLRPSRRLQGLFWIANSLGLLAIFVSAAPLLVKWAVLLCLLIFARWQWRRTLSSNGPQRVVGLRWRGDAFQIRLNQPFEWQTVELLPGSRCWPGWLVLYLKTPKARRCLILPCDVGDAESLRRLQILLRFFVERR